MRGYHDNIEELTNNNKDYRHVLYTGPNMQLVLMCLQPGEEIGSEVHKDHDQFFRFESGIGKVDIDEQTYNVKDGDAIIVPAGAQHNVSNTSVDTPLKLYTIYTPPEHPDGTIQHTKS